jgi:hypothetical protein
MTHRLMEIRDAVTFADEIVQDKDYDHREVHYHRKGSGPLRLKVVIHYRPVSPSGWAGEVVTAHFTSRSHRLEVPIWPTRDP